MPKYTVQSPSGKKVTFQWDSPEPPTDADMDEIFGEVETPDFSDVQAGGSPGKGKFSTPPSALDDFNSFNTNWGLGVGKGLGQAAINLANVGQDFTGVRPIGKGLGVDTTIPTPEALQASGDTQQMGALAGRITPGLMTAPMGGIGGAVLGGAIGGAAETGESWGALAGAAAGAAGGVTAAALPYAARGAKAAYTAAEQVPGLGKLVRGTTGFMSPRVRGLMEALQGAKEMVGSFNPPPVKASVAPNLTSAADEAKQMLVARKAAESHAEALEDELMSAIKEAKELAALQGDVVEAPTRAANSGTTPGPAFPPPPGMGASGPPPSPVTRPGAPTSGSGLGTAVETEVPAGLGAASGLPPVPRRAPGAPTSGTGNTPGPAFAPPPGMGAGSATPPVPKKAPGAPASSTGFQVSPTSTPNVTVRAGAPPAMVPATPPKPKHTVEEAVNRIKAAKTPQERGAIIKELAAGGSDKASRGAALSNATNKPLDIDDLSEAKDFLKQAGSLDKALEIIRNHPENSVQDVIKLSRAVREASRQAPKV